MRRSTHTPPEHQDYSKRKLGLMSSVVFNTPYDKNEGNATGKLQRYFNNAQKVNAYQFAGLGFKRAILALIESDERAKKAFCDGLETLNAKRRTMGRSNLMDFHGMKGFSNIMRSIDTYGFLRGLSPYNLVLFCAIFLDEMVIDIAQLAAKDGEAPSVLCMSTHFIVGGATGLTRALISAACEPFNHAKKDLQIFTIATVIALTTFSLITFLGADDSAYELAGAILGSFCHMMGLHERGDWVFPLQTLITVFVIIQGALTVGGMANIVPVKFKQMRHDLGLISRRYPDWYLSQGVKFMSETFPAMVRSISQHGEVPLGEVGHPLTQLGDSGGGFGLNQ